MKKLSLVLLALASVLALANVSYAGNQWSCTATNARNQHWSWYGNTKAIAYNRVTLECAKNSLNAQNCNVSCTPPVIIWRCMSVDSAGNQLFWDSTSKAVAITNARDACKYNSKTGGCTVQVGSCSPLN